MSQIHQPWFAEDEVSERDQADANRQTASLGGLVVALFLVVVGLFLVHQLYAKAALEDCLLSGNTTCGLYTLH